MPKIKEAIFYGNKNQGVNYDSGDQALNGNPSKAQKDFHNELREMFFETEGAGGELHHVFGSKAKFKLLKEAGIEKPGEWFVILIHKDVHKNINEYSFEAERGMFLKQIRDYEKFFGKKCPIPPEVVKYYEAMLSKHYRLKSWSECNEC